MRWNPVFRREMTVGSRSIRMMAILFVLTVFWRRWRCLICIRWRNRSRTTAEIQYSQFLDLYTFVSSIEFIMLLFIMPALTASSISGEQERQTLELMLTTTMEPRDMVLGKLASLAGDDAGAGGLGASGTGARICLQGRYAAGHRDAVPNATALWQF